MSGPSRRLDGWALADAASLYALVAASFSQIDVQRLGRDTFAEGLGYTTRTFSLALSDVLLVAVALWFVARTTRLRAWNRLWWPPLPVAALLFALVVSLAHSPTIWTTLAAGGQDANQGLRQALVQIAQWSAYFALAPWLLVNLLFDRRSHEAAPIDRVEGALKALFLGVLASGVAASVQSQIWSEGAPRGLWSSPHIYGAAIAMVLPLLFEAESPRPATQLRFWISSAAVTALALWTVISPAALGAAALGLAAAAIARWGSARARAFRLALVAALIVVGVATWRLAPGVQAERAAAVRLASEEAPVRKQFVEWGAALGFAAERTRPFATGYGPGNYQLNIGPLYSMLPNEERMPPDSNNLWWVQALSLGALGLGALLWTLGHFARRGWMAARSSLSHRAWPGAGAFGSLVAWGAVAFFHAPLVRGAALVLMFLLALCIVAQWRLEPGTTTSRTSGSKSKNRKKGNNSTARES